MVGDDLVGDCGGEFAVRDEGFEILGVVLDYVVSADLLVFVGDGVHAMGAAGDDEFWGEGVEGGDVFVGQLAVKVFVAGAAGGVSGAAFGFAEDGEVNFGVGEELDEGAGGFLSGGVVACGAAYPVEDVGGGIFCGGGNGEAFSPVHALCAVDAPRVLGALHAAEGGLEWGGEVGFDHDLVPADVEDVEHLLVLRGADGHAGSAGCTGPGGFGREGELKERLRGLGWGVELHALVDFVGGGGEGFSSCGGGADVLAAVALDAGVGVKQAGPGEVFEILGAEGGGVLGGDVEGGDDSRAGAAGHGVFGWGEKDVDVLGVGEVREEREDATEGSPKAENVKGLGVGCGDGAGEEGSEGLGLAWACEG